ncbi:MBL fold metallo-hydrolase [Paenibacillus sp. FJAT-26967]|uniref:MBL fold metallo-hydrolase n=1 Tax=Paenibacillus sp. FJAT-26967 TaxID=1729690 RepID=UPI000AA2E76A|nr:MBL fold metallo-hydrolase [Paenibacillus sp. FJAT-26967]
MRPERLTLNLRSTGSCKQLEAFSIRGGRWRFISFPGIFGMIEHPEKGLILFDTGYAPRFMEATRKFPYRIYRWMTPVDMENDFTAADHVRAAGYSPDEVRTIIISHFHADHICGLRDFPNAKFICSREGYSAISVRKGFAAVKRAFLPDLMPADFEARAVWIESADRVKLPAEYAPFAEGYDLFGDGKLIAIALPGHADHQIGILLTDGTSPPVLLGADAGWSRKAVQENRLPHPLAFTVFDSSRDYKATFGRLVELSRKNPGLRQVFTHCPEARALCELPYDGGDCE